MNKNPKVLRWLVVAGSVFFFVSSFHSRGLAARPAWTGSRVKGAPTQSLPYYVQRVFGDFDFHHPVTLTSAPGTDSMFLLEQHGKIYELPSDASNDRRVVIDLTEVISDFHVAYGLDFHPDFGKNREVFICYLRKGDRDDGTIVSRFRLNDEYQIEPDSEQVVITWQKDGHNGGCVKFGPDGLLYITAGDADNPFPPDHKRVGQDITNLLSTIMRIDVDHPSAGRSYSIPATNPFVHLPNVRHEVYAFGFRNPWRMAFDRQTGDLWVGDVGWERWEMIYDVTSGGNYGWPIVEGPETLFPEESPGPSPILKPAASHSHAEARSITGGQVYYGDRLPELRGDYIYGDHVTGRIWKLRKRDGQIGEPVEIARAPLQIICFGLHHSGEVYIVDYAGGIYQLMPRASQDQNDAFPITLSETGIFESVATMNFAPGVLEYKINAEPWMDGGTATRFLAVPGTQTIDVYRKGGGHANWDGKHRGSWKFPKDSVLGKTISLEGRRVETQLMHYDGQAWQGYSYLWNEEQTDATLAEDRTQTIEIELESGTRQWLVSNRSDCMICHTNANDMLLGFKPEQLSRPEERTESGNTISLRGDLARFDKMGLFGEKPRVKQTLVDPHDESYSLDSRARAYLHVNCAHCHRRNGGGSVPMDVLFDKPLDQTLTVGVTPSQGDFGIDQAQVIRPADPARSILLYRFSKFGPGHMPKLGGLEIDHRGATLIYHWIRQLPAAEASSIHPTPSLEEWDTLSDEQLLQSLSDIPTSIHAAHSLRTAEAPPSLRERILAISSQLPPATKDLFEPFVPWNERTVRLGNEVNVEEVLRTKGDPVRGRALFLSASMTCKTCHAVAPRQVNGGDADSQSSYVGPNLSQLEPPRYVPVTLLTSILEPSKEIAAAYRQYVVQTVDGETFVGVRKEVGDRVIVLDAQNRRHEILKSEIETEKVMDVSIMPEKLLADFTLQQAADLLAFLAGLNPRE